MNDNSPEHYTDVLDSAFPIYPNAPEMSPEEVDKILGFTISPSQSFVRVYPTPVNGPLTPTEIRATIKSIYSERSDVVKTVPERILASVGRLASHFKK